MSGAIADIASGVANWRTSYQLGVQDIVLRYRRSVLGPFWITAALVTQVLALSYIFAPVFRQGLPAYVAHLSAGLLAWNLVQAFISEGGHAVVEHTAHLRNVPLPLSVMAGRIAFRNAIIFAHNLVAIIGIYVGFHRQFSWQVLQLIPALAILLLLGFFLVMVLGPLCARFRDVPQVLGSIMQVMYFLTPIIWVPSAMSTRPAFMEANPFYHLVQIVRAPLEGSLVPLRTWFVCVVLCVASGVAALISVALTRKRLNLWV